MITTGIRDLKAHLSRYLHRVEQGECILVTDRGRVIAQLGPPSNELAGQSIQARYQQLVEEGTIQQAVAPRDREWAQWGGMALPAGTARALIDADRGE